MKFEREPTGAWIWSLERAPHCPAAWSESPRHAGIPHVLLASGLAGRSLPDWGAGSAAVRGGWGRYCGPPRSPIGPLRRFAGLCLRPDLRKFYESGSCSVPFDTGDASKNRHLGAARSLRRLEGAVRRAVVNAPAVVTARHDGALQIDSPGRALDDVVTGAAARGKSRKANAAMVSLRSAARRS